MSSARLLTESSNALSKSLARLSSGSRLAFAEDDVAGTATSMKFDAQINRVGAAQSNIGNAISFNQTQDGFLKKVSKALDRMSELSTLAQDVTKSDTDRGQYQLEFAKLQTYINDLATKDFNGISLFNGATLDVTTDSETGKFSNTGIDLGATIYTGPASSILNPYAAATSTSTKVDTAANAASALTTVKAAIDRLATDRATVGSNIAVLSSYNDQLGVLKDNLSAANSRIKDVDVADESTKFARNNILVQAGTAMLAQANTSTQAALRLLQ